MDGVKVGSAYAELNLKTDGLTKGVTSAQKSLSTLQKAAAGMFAGLGVGAAVGFGAVVKSAFDMNATLETVTLQFETLMGSAAKAQTHVASLFEIAKRTPFETGPIIEASKYLQTFGGEALNTEANVLLIGDAAAATSAPIEDLGFWVGRLYANLQAGQPFGEAAMRLQELGVIGPQVVNDLREMQENGASADEMFAYLSADLERFGGAMEKQAGTWSGMMSTITDSLKMAAAEGLKPFFEGAKVGLEQVIALLSDPAFAESLKSFATQMGEFTAKLLPFLVEHGPALVKLLGALIAGFGALTVTTKVTAAFTTLAPIVAKLIALFGGASAATAATGAAATTAAAGTGVLGTALTTLTGPIGWVIAAVGLLAVAWAKDWGGIREKTAAAVDFIRGYVEKGLAAIRALWEQYGGGIAAAARHIWAAVTLYFRTAWENIKSIFRVFAAAFRGDWEEVGRQLQQIWQRTLDMVVEVFTHLWEAIKPALVSFLTALIQWWMNVDWADLGRKAIKGIASGLKGAYEAGQRLAEGVVEGAKGIAKGWQEAAAASGEWAQWAASEAEAVAERQAKAIQQGAETADRAMTTYANGYKTVVKAQRSAYDLTLSQSAALRMYSQNVKDVPLDKFAAGIDGLTAAAQRNKQALEEAEARAQQYAAAFGAVQGDYVTELPQAEAPLVTPERTVSVVTQVSGPTEEQSALAERYTGELEKLREKYAELTNGIGTFGMEQDKLDAVIADTAGEIAHYEGLLGTIPAAVNEVSSSQQGLKVNVDAVHQGIYDQLVQMGAAPEVITAYAVATGIMTEAQARAALQAAAVKVKIEELAGKIAEGMPIDKALADLDTFIAKIETGVTPAAETMATDVPLAMAPMAEEMSTQATDAGTAVPTNIAAGITDNLEVATTAATGAADAITQAVRDAHGIESPSAVFAEIGGQDIAGFIEGVEGAEGDAVSAMESVGQATVDAWDETITAADGIGVSIMDGVIAGVESRRTALVAKMKEIAQEAYAVAMTELKAKSPSRLFMRMGEAIITGVVAGLDATEDTLYGKLTEIAGVLAGIGEQMFGFQSDALEESIDDTTDRMTEAFNALRGAYGNAAVNSLLAMSPGERAYFARTLRMSAAYTNDVDARRRLDEAIRLADERNALEEEYIRQQEELARLEEERAKLDFLQTQVDLLNLIRENNLSTDILDGLALGLDASMTDVIAAMTEAVRQLVERANEELEIASPSAVFARIGQQVMAGMAEGITRSRDVEARLGQSLGRLTELGIADTRALQSRLQAGLNQAIRVDATGAGTAPAQTFYNYGGMYVTVPNGTTASQMREMFFQGLLYQGQG